MNKCKICGEPSEWVFNINLKAIPICDNCSKSITKQTVAQI
jgi:hypothetical protein